MFWKVLTGGGIFAWLLARSRRVPPPGFAWADFFRGCEEYATPGTVGDLEREGFRRLAPYVRLMWGIHGRAHIRGWWRPPDCNEARRGSPRSRHIAGWAVDMDLTPAQTARLYAKLRQLGVVDERGNVVNRARWGRYVRRTLGINEYVGLKIYRSGNTHIDLGCPPAATGCDPRSRDWVEVEWRP